MIYESKNLIIREITQDDFMPFSQYMFEENYWKYVAIPESNADSLKHWMQESIRQQRLVPRKSYFLGVLEKKTEQVIGDALLSITSFENEEAEIGWGLSHLYRGQGYGAEIGRNLLDFAFHQLGVYRVYARCHPQNKASIRIMEKLGMKQEGELREHIKVRGERWSSLQYSMLSKEYVSAIPSKK